MRHGEQILARALDAHRKGDEEAAERLYRETIAAEDAGAAEALFNLAALRAGQGRHEEAVALYRLYLGGRPDDAQGHSNLGNALQALGRCEEAEAAYLRALALDPALAPAHVNYGQLCLTLQRYEDAERRYGEAIAIDPLLAAAYVNLGALLHAQERWAEARPVIETALAIDPDDVDARRTLGLILLELDEAAAAEAEFREEIRLAPGLPGPICRLGKALARRKLPDEAIEAYEAALAVDPRHGESWHEIAFAHAAADRPEQAEAAFAQARSIEPRNAAYAYNLGHFLLKRGRKADALRAFEEAAALAADAPEILLGLANGLLENARAAEALAVVDDALGRRPQSADGLNLKGNCLVALERTEQALACYREALALKPELGVLSYNVGNALRRLGRLDEAALAFERALELEPDLASARNGLGLVRQQQNRHDEAIAEFDLAIELNPQLGDAFNNRALSWQALGRFTKALADYSRLLELYPDRVEAYFNYGGLLQLLERWDESITIFRKGLELDPDCAIIYPYLAHALQQQCNWSNLDAVVERIRDNTVAELDAGRHVSVTPFALQSIPGPFPMALRRRIAEAVSDRIARQAGAADGRVFFAHAPRPRRAKLRVGYVSPDFRFHSVAVAFKGVLDAHDRERFEWRAYSLHGGRKDDMNRQFRETFDSFADIGHLPMEDAARLIHEDGVDVLIDLAGHTRGTRLEIFAMRPAPVQAHYLGFTSTVGARFLDYLVTDARLAPPDHRPHYTEKLVLLPDSFMAGRRAPIAEERPTRAEEGLPEDGFVFANFNNRYKFEPRMFAAWMRLLRRAPGSVLWLLRGTPKSDENLRREAAARGVDPARLVFAQPKRHPQHLARLALADLALDNLFHGGGVTTLDALWVGVPVVTIAGDALPSRNGASLLPAVGLGDLVTASLAEYDRLVLSLARDPARLAEAKRRLAANREHLPLFDVERLARHLERGYDLMWQRFERGLAPAEIEVPALPADATEIGRRRP
jgi:predicted O-linked N-acetylglucosamine transferase (SPINDLY family)